MREILFRGKPKGGEWLEGFMVSQCHIGDWVTCEPVCPETIGQFTGLTDTNGKKVFEGDILKFTDTNAKYEWIGRVEFGNPNAEYNWGFQLVYISGTKANIDILMWFDMEESGAFCEVIGNIHDNPELLGGDWE